MQRNPEVSSIKSFVGIQLHPNWLNACNLRFASNVGLSYNVRLIKDQFMDKMDTYFLLSLAQITKLVLGNKVGQHGNYF